MSKINENLPYIRIGCAYMRKINMPLMSGDNISRLIVWNKATILDDHSEDKNILKKIPKFLGAVAKPDHLNYKRDIEGFYNTYEPMQHTPSEGNCDSILIFFKHIFQDQFEIGLDYFKLLYEKPTQLLPILCLVSIERKTGKTTFLDFLKAVFGHNMTINSTQDMQSRFNSDLSGKLLIGIEEVLFEKLEDTERLKHLSTSKSFKSEAKGKDREEVNFFAKFILISNHEQNFIKIQPGEDRFWIIKVVPFEKENVDLLAKMTAEIPAFLHFIQNRPYNKDRMTRMWFKQDDLFTEALKKVVNYGKNRFEIEIISIFLTIMENFEAELIQFQINDLVNLMSKSSKKVDISELREIVKQKWGLIPVKNSLSYKKYVLLSDGSFNFINEKGRYYSITKEWIKSNFDDLMMT